MRFIKVRLFMGYHLQEGYRLAVMFYCVHLSWGLVTKDHKPFSITKGKFFKMLDFPSLSSVITDDQ
jgi:hypothetical protein